MWCTCKTAVLLIKTCFFAVLVAVIVALCWTTTFPSKQDASLGKPVKCRFWRLRMEFWFSWVCNEYPAKLSRRSSKLWQKLQQGGAELRTVPQNSSLFHSTQRTIYTAIWPKHVQIGKFRTLQPSMEAANSIRFTQFVPRLKTERVEFAKIFFKYLFSLGRICFPRLIYCDRRWLLFFAY